MKYYYDLCAHGDVCGVCADCTEERDHDSASLGAISEQHVDSLLRRTKRHRRATPSRESLQYQYEHHSGKIERLDGGSCNQNGISPAIVSTRRQNVSTGKPTSNGRSTMPEYVALQSKEQSRMFHDGKGEDDWIDVSEGEEQNLSNTIEPNNSNVGIEISLERESKRSITNKKRKQSWTKRDREIAQLVHRTHALCLLGRAMLYDKAADDVQLQAMVLSILPSTFVRPSDDKTSNPRDQFHSANPNSMFRIAKIQEWFRREFNLESDWHSSRKSNQTMFLDEISTALSRGCGLDSLKRDLYLSFERRRGNPEELVALFASLLRALGILTRTVHLLQPSSLRPGDAARQQEHAVKAFLKKRSLNMVDKNVLNGPDCVNDANTSTKTVSTKEKRTNSTRINERKGHEKNIKTEIVKESKFQVDKNDMEDQKSPVSLKRKRKGDVEEEIAMAMAIAATDFARESKESCEEKQLACGSENEVLSGTITNQDKTSDSNQVKRKSVKARKDNRPGAAYGNHGLLVGQYWLEVFCCHSHSNVHKGSDTLSQDRWVHFDPITGWFDQPENVEGLVARPNDLAYVVACAGGGAKDVTRRYTSSFQASLKQRDEKWWQELLQPLRAKEIAVVAAWQHNGLSLLKGDPQSISERRKLCRNLNSKNLLRSYENGFEGTQGGRIEQAKAIVAQEERELEERVKMENRTLPSSIEGFKRHPIFVLKRHIGKYQALKPESKIVGSHRGEPYYMRKDIADIHTADRWKRLGREVIPEELPYPVKSMKKRSVHQSSKVQDLHSGSTAMEEEDEEEAYINMCSDLSTAEYQARETSAYYGLWQTKSWKPPPAVGGIVPKNERGNVEVPPFASELPEGTVHIQLPGISAICRKLDIDWAHALVGFEIRGGRSVPSIDGVVVCIEHEDKVREAYQNDLRQKAELARQKRYLEAEALWNSLLRALITRARLGAAYGKGSEVEAAAEIVHHQSHKSKEKDSRSTVSEKVVKNQVSINDRAHSAPSAIESGRNTSPTQTEMMDVEVEEI